MIKGRNLFYEKVSPLKPLFQKFGVLKCNYKIQHNIQEHRQSNCYLSLSRAFFNSSCQHQ